MIMLVKMDVRRMLITIKRGSFKREICQREMEECHFCFWIPDVWDFEASCCVVAGMFG